MFSPRFAQRTSLSPPTIFGPFLPLVLDSTTNVEIINYCHQQIDPGFSPLVNSSNGHTTGGFILESREHATVKLPAGWIGNIWPRTGCDIYGTCETGQCPGGVNCTGIAIPGSDYTRAYFSISRDAYVACFICSQALRNRLTHLPAAMARTSLLLARMRDSMFPSASSLALAVRASLPPSFFIE